MDIDKGGSRIGKALDDDLVVAKNNGIGIGIIGLCVFIAVFIFGVFANDFFKLIFQ